MPGVTSSKASGQRLSRYIRAQTGIPVLDFTKEPTPRLVAPDLTLLLGVKGGVGRDQWTAALERLPEDGVAAVLRQIGGISMDPGDVMVMTRLKLYVPLLEVWNERSQG